MKQGHWRFIAAAITLTIVVLCLWPAESLPDYGAGPLDKLHHVLAFAAFAFAWRLAGIARPHVLLLGLLLAAATEFGQGWMGLGRSGELLDGVADVAGLVLGLLIAAWAPLRATNAPSA